MKTKLRTHQVQGIESLRAAIREGARRLVLSAPTGSGKTVLAAAVAELASAKGNSIWFLTTSIGLADQAARAFAAEGLDCRLIQGKRDEGSADAAILVGTVQSISRRRVPLPRVVVIDEAHLLHGAHERIIASVVKAGGCAIGLSATPFGRRVAKAFPTIIAPTNIAALTKSGVLAPARILGTGEVDPSSLKIVRGDFDEGEMAQLFDRDPEVAATVAGWMKHGENRSTVAFAANVAHAHRLAAGFRSAGIAAEAISGDDKPAYRDAVLDRLRSGETRVVTNCQLLVAGFDYPGLGALILARATCSTAVLMQATGRVLRSAPDKRFGLILDHGRNFERLGLPVQIGPTGEPVGDLPTRCQHCSTVDQHLALACAACGEDREPTRRDLTRWWSGLLGLAAERNRPRGWAAHTFRDRFAMWPNGIPDLPETPSAEVAEFVHRRAAAWRARNAA